MHVRHTRPAILFVTVALLLGLGMAAGEEPQNWRSLKREAKRARIDEMADLALKKVLAGNEKAQALYDKAYGWAAFDNLKLALGFSGGGGNGVAVAKASGDRTYMKMGTFGVGLGIGGKKYQVVFLFQDQQTFDGFVQRGWQADAAAGAVAGNQGVNVQTDFVNGLAVYQLTDTGLMANADIAGTKYWKNKKLNR